MQTMAEARAWAMDEFRHAGVESSALASDLLLGFVTGRDRIYVLSHTEEKLSDAFWSQYRALVLRHAKGEPLQYLTGEREFYGLDFRVTPAVLIPRPETEILVGAVLRIIQGNYNSGMKFVDVGTGSGCIAVSIAHSVPLSNGWATDISKQALEIAHLNASRHGVSGRIQFVQADLLECFSRKPAFDFILSNPPYVTLEEYDTLPSSVRDYEPHRALLGGGDGLDLYRRFIPEVLPRLKPGGFLLLESGAGQAERIGRIIEKEGLVLQEVLDDLQKIPRCLIARNV
jgi:release factor glutamine methyltransferase